MKFFIATLAITTTFASFANSDIDCFAIVTNSSSDEVVFEQKLKTIKDPEFGIQLFEPTEGKDFSFAVSRSIYSGKKDDEYLSLSMTNSKTNKETAMLSRVPTKGNYVVLLQEKGSLVYRLRCEMN